MSKNGKTKFRWVDDYEDDNYEYKNKKKNKSRRDEKRMRSALKGKDLRYFMTENE